MVNAIRPAARRKAARNPTILSFTSAGFSRWRKWPAPSAITTSDPVLRTLLVASAIVTSMQPSRAPWR
jgi:hypothetical protein